LNRTKKFRRKSRRKKRKKASEDFETREDVHVKSEINVDEPPNKKKKKKKKHSENGVKEELIRT